MSKDGLINDQGQVYVRSKIEPEKQIVLLFSGEWKNGAMDGQGSYTYFKFNDPKLAIFEYSGSWKNGLQEGNGSTGSAGAATTPVNS